jgi:hypothetical protein
MNNILEFKLVPKPVVEIVRGIVTSSTTTDAKGVRINEDEIGRHRYFIDVIEADGTRIGMWDGESRRQANREALELSIEFGARIRDMTGDAA